MNVTGLVMLGYGIHPPNPTYKTEAVYVLHCFKKKTNTTSKHDKEVATTRYKAVIQDKE